MKTAALLLISFVCYGWAHAAEKCSIRYLSLAASARPLILGVDNTLFRSHFSDLIEVPHGNSVTFSCKQHKIVNSNNNSIEALCNNGQLEVDNESFQYSQASCELRVIELFSAISPKCNGQLAIYRFYEVTQNISGETETEPVPEDETRPEPEYSVEPEVEVATKSEPEDATESEDLYESISIIAETCFNQKTSTPIYSHFKVSPEPKYVEYNPAIISGPFMPSEEAQITYISAKLNKKIIDLLGEENMPNDTLLAVPLIPTELVHEQFTDVSLRPHNMIGMWRKIRFGNWKHLLNDINFINRGNRVFDIYTGTYKVLHLPNAPSNFTYLYLQTNRGKDDPGFPVPAYVWTVVYEAATLRGAAFVLVNNNIHIENLGDLSVCNSMCHRISWIRNLKKMSRFDQSNLGYMMCCDIRSFRAAVTDIPAIDDLVLYPKGGLLID